MSFIYIYLCTVFLFSRLKIMIAKSKYIYFFPFNWLCKIVFKRDCNNHTARVPIPLWVHTCCAVVWVTENSLLEWSSLEARSWTFTSHIMSHCLQTIPKEKAQSWGTQLSDWEEFLERESPELLATWAHSRRKNSSVKKGIWPQTCTPGVNNTLYVN